MVTVPHDDLDALISICVAVFIRPRSDRELAGAHDIAIWKGRRLCAVLLAGDPVRTVLFPE